MTNIHKFLEQFGVGERELANMVQRWRNMFPAVKQYDGCTRSTALHDPVFPKRRERPTESLDAEFEREAAMREYQKDLGMFGPMAWPLRPPDPHANVKDRNR